MKFQRIVLISVLVLILSWVNVLDAASVKIKRVAGDRDLYYKKYSSGRETIRNWEIGVPVLNIDTIGRGYDVIYGNPIETSVGGDKGYRDNVFVVDTSAEATTADWRVVKANHVDISHMISCSMTTNTKEMSSSKEVQNTISSSVTQSHDVSGGISGGKGDYSGGLEAGYSHTASEGYNEMSGAVENKDSTIVQMEAECSVYKAKMNPFHWPKFTDQFQKAVGTLPTAFNQNTKEQFADFVKAFGTSVVTETLMGSRYGRMYEIKSDAYETFKEKEKLKESESAFSIELSGEKSSGDDEEEEEDGDANDGGEEGGNEESESNEKEKEEEEDEEEVSGSASVKYGNSKSKSQREAERQQNALSNLASNEMSYAVGARPAETVEEWVQESEADPQPIRIQVTPLTDIVAHIDKAKAMALGQFYAQYRPVGVMAPKQQLGKCYLSKASHLIMENKKSPRSLIAKCRPGTTVVGGAFFHLFNEHDDLKVNAHLADIQALKDQLKEYEKLRNQKYEVQYLLKNGAKMVKDFAKERGIRDLKDILGDRVDPKFIHKFLSGQLLDLGIKKKKALHGIANGLKVFGESKLGELASKMLKNNPYSNAVFKVSDSLAKELKDKMKPANPQENGPGKTEVLSVSEELDQFINEAGNEDVIASHVDTLAEIMNSLDKQFGPAGADEEDVETLIFGKIGEWLKKAHDHISSHINRIFGHVTNHINAALKKWSKFTGQFDEIRKNMRGELLNARNRRTDASLYQDLMKQVQDDILAIHGKIVLAQRNSLSWMFPYRGRQFVCASGNKGMFPTRRSSFGYCSAYCCSNMAGWKFRTETSRKKTIDHKLKTATTTVKCPSGYSVLSGGILISDYHASRFVQVTASTPVGEDSYKCSVKWTETSYVPQVPKYKCYARCAMPQGEGARLKCITKETVLVNGHATVHCPSTTMAMGGGWDVKSHGVTYLKKTSYGKVQKNTGARSYRCELGTSHDVITGKCVARCCNINPTGVEAEVMKKDRQCRDPTSHYTHLGSKLKFGQEMGLRDVIHSSDKKFYLKMRPNIWRKRVYLTMVETHKCRRPEHLNTVSFSIRTCIYQFWQFRQKQLEQINKIIQEEKEKQKAESEKQAKEKFDSMFGSLFGKKKVSTSVTDQASSDAVKATVGSEAQKKKPTFTRPVTWRDFYFGLKLKMTENGFVFVTPFSDEPCSRGKEVGNKNVDYMSVSDVGDLNFYNDEKEAIYSYRWSKCRMLHKQVRAKKSVLRSGEMMHLGSGLVTRDKLYTFVFENGGGITLYRQRYSKKRCNPPEIVFSTTGKNDMASMAEFNRHTKTAWTLRLNEDNNLVMSDEKGQTKWESKTAGKGYGNAQLRIVDGDIELIDSLGQVFWTYRTGSVADCESVREDLKIRSNVYGVGHFMDHTYGGLVSKNGEYVLHVREDNSGGKDTMSLEIWRDGSREDCTKARFCVLAENVKKVKITKDGLQGQGMDGKYRTIFALKGLDEIKLKNSGLLYAYGGETEHRHSIKKPVQIGTCKFHAKTVIDKKK